MTSRTAAALVAAAVLALPAGASAAKKEKGEEVEVMSRNVYLGADLNPAIQATSIEAAIDAAGVIYNDVVRTNFNERAIPLAKEINKAKPSLIGLQEVAHWQTQTPSDGGGPPITGGTPATETSYDFLALLTDRLPDYRVVGVQNEFSAELPTDIDGSDATGTIAGADFDARLTMRDVILARKGVKTSKLEQDNYTTRFETSVGGIPIGVDRGWLSTEAKVGKTKFRFVNTHFEAFGDDTIREAQAKELVDVALSGKGDIVLAGDLNSGLKKPHEIFDTDQLAYKAVLAGGMIDRGVVQTCCYPSEMDDPSFVFDHTVDHIMVNNPKITLVKGKSFVTGNDKGEITPSGLWPSDHGGVVSTLRFP